MPITKSVIKRMHQGEARRRRNLPLKTNVKTMIRKVRDYVHEGKIPEASKLLPSVYKIIDLAAKKHIIHWKNAARKKSMVAKLVG